MRGFVQHADLGQDQHWVSHRMLSDVQVRTGMVCMQHCRLAGATLGRKLYGILDYAFMKDMGLISGCQVRLH
jgi:hypothetical protein